MWELLTMVGNGKETKSSKKGVDKKMGRELWVGTDRGEGRKRGAVSRIYRGRARKPNLAMKGLCKAFGIKVFLTGSGILLLCAQNEK